jgi:general secretion pathway protein J
VKARGFTLIEVMIAVVITAMIGVMVAGTFQRAYATKEVVERQEERFGSARLALSRMAREVSMAFVSDRYDRRQFRDRPTLFQGKDGGDQDELLFTSFAHARLTRDAKESDQTVIEYRVEADPDSQGEYALFRREKPRIDDSPDRGGTRAKLCEHVAAFEISYWDWSKQDWVREWSSNSTERQGMLPTRVRFKLTLKMPDGAKKPFSTQARLAMIRPLDF